MTTAAANTDFSLLPSGFLANSFTDIPSIGWSPDSKWVALRADHDTNGQYDLFLIRWSAPGTAERPYTALGTGGVSTWSFAPNAQAVAFVGTIGTETAPGLHLATLPASGALSAALLSVADAATQTDVTWLPGSRVILYRAGASKTQLLSVAIDSNGAAATLLPVSGASKTAVVSYQIDPPR